MIEWIRLPFLLNLPIMGVIGGSYLGLGSGSFLNGGVLLLFMVIQVFFMGLWSEGESRLWFFSFLISVISGLFFLAKSFVVLFILFESVLLPMGIVIFGWGGQPERLQAALWFFLYAVFFSFPFFTIVLLLSKDSNLVLSVVGTIFVTGAFLVKLPAYFLHLWLPKAHTEAPTVGSILLAGILLKLGGFGLYQLMFFSSSGIFLVAVLVGICGLIASAVSCCFQADAKALVALSSVVHMNFLLLVLGSGSLVGVTGSFILMFSHGVVSGMMFFLIGAMAHYFHSRALLFLSGGSLIGPYVFFLLIFMFMSNMGVPPSLSFFSEMMFVGGQFKLVKILGGVFMVSLLFSCYFSVFAGTNLLHGKKVIGRGSQWVELKFTSVGFMILLLNVWVLGLLP